MVEMIKGQFPARHKLGEKETEASSSRRRSRRVLRLPHITAAPAVLHLVGAVDVVTVFVVVVVLHSGHVAAFSFLPVSASFCSLNLKRLPHPAHLQPLSFLSAPSPRSESLFNFVFSVQYLSQLLHLALTILPWSSSPS